MVYLTNTHLTLTNIMVWCAPPFFTFLSELPAFPRFHSQTASSITTNPSVPTLLLEARRIKVSSTCARLLVVASLVRISNCSRWIWPEIEFVGAPMSRGQIILLKDDGLLAKQLLPSTTIIYARLNYAQ